MIEVKNKNYQAIKLLVNDKIVILESKNKKIFKLAKPTEQMKNAEAGGYISIKQI